MKEKNKDLNEMKKEFFSRFSNDENTYETAL